MFLGPGLKVGGGWANQPIPISIDTSPSPHLHAREHRLKHSYGKGKFGFGKTCQSVRRILGKLRSSAQKSGLNGETKRAAKSAEKNSKGKASKHISLPDL